MAGIRTPAQSLAPWLWLLLFLFVLRVLGKMLVAFAGAEWLPPMSEWISGLLPYPYLLVSQFIIIGVSAIVAMDFTRGAGRKKNHLRRDHDGPTEMLDRAGLVE